MKWSFIAEILIKIVACLAGHSSPSVCGCYFFGMCGAMFMEVGELLESVL